MASMAVRYQCQFQNHLWRKKASGPWMSSVPWSLTPTFLQRSNTENIWVPPPLPGKLPESQGTELLLTPSHLFSVEGEDSNSAESLDSLLTLSLTAQMRFCPSLPSRSGPGRKSFEFLSWKTWGWSCIWVHYFLTCKILIVLTHKRVHITHLLKSSGRSYAHVLTTQIKKTKECCSLSREFYVKPFFAFI